MEDSSARAGGSAISADGMRLVALGPDEVVVKRGLSEARIAFDGAADALGRLADLADGTRTEEEIVGSFPDDLGDDVRRLIVALRRRAVLHEPVGDDPAAVFWSIVAPLAPAAEQRLRTSSALVIGTGPVAGALVAALRDCGVGRVDVSATFRLAGDADLWCAAAAGSPEPGLTDAGRAALAAGRVFLPVWLDDLVIRVGPLTHPYDTACLRCYLLRVDADDPEREVHRLFRDHATPATPGFLPTMARTAGQIAATEAVKHLAGLPVTACGRALELSLVPFKAAVHRVLRVPRCPECGGTARQGAPVVTRGSQLSE